MLKRQVAAASFALLLFAAGASAESLKLPDNLAGFSTAAGETYFAESEAREAYFPLASNFLTQKTQAYCGVASIVMVLNSLGVAAPTTPEYEPYHTFTQDNVLNAATEAVLPADVLAHKGMTLDQHVVLGKGAVRLVFGDRRRRDAKRVQDHDEAGDATIGLSLLRQEIAGEREISLMRIALGEIDFAVMGAESGQIVGQRQGVGVRACDGQR